MDTVCCGRLIIVANVRARRALLIDTRISQGSVVTQRRNKSIVYSAPVTHSAMLVISLSLKKGRVDERTDQ